ncbi:MAG TPA: FtsQ-type POTRA domain-containing protein [Thermoflexia bacterium]|nr:FtsQ-type POTRA domain-containing protein [Thermoflexia bacterium]
MPRTKARRRRKPRQQRYEQSVPLVLRGRTVPRPRVQPRWSVGATLLVVALLVGAVALWLTFSPRFYVLQVEVEGTNRVSPEEVFAASGLERLHILWVNEKEAEARIVEQIPSVTAASVVCRLPADCVIRVEESPMLATWQVEGSLFWVDQAGGVIPATEPLAGGWYVTGPIGSGGQVDEDVITALVELERLGVPPQPVMYREGRGLVLTDEEGWKVIVGEGSGMAERMAVYARVKEYLLANGIHPLFVDVRFPKAPYYSVTNEW